MTVYDCGGECLGDEWINLSELQLDTKKAISHMVYLDKIANAKSHVQQILEIKEKGLK